ncbi:MAG: hypothetical protein FJ253_03355 [Phycisphaerae bacterium]|nr:hypothetical protein [Phycisphaerae bacterium]
MAETAPWGNLPSYEADPPPAPAVGVNGWGIAGFVIGIVSLCAMGGVLAPIGLLLSVIGLFKRPRGWAVAGFASNLAGLCCCMPFAFPVLLVMIGVVSASAMTLWVTTTFRGSLGSEGVTAIHAFMIGFMLIAFYAQHKKVPESLNELDLDKAVFVDGWGKQFHYERTDDPEGFELWSSGGDGADGTADDIEFRGRVRGGSLDFEHVDRKQGGAAGSGASAPRGSGADDSTGGDSGASDSSGGDAASDAPPADAAPKPK